MISYILVKQKIVDIFSPYPRKYGYEFGRPAHLGLPISLIRSYFHIDLVYKRINAGIKIEAYHCLAPDVFLFSFFFLFFIGQCCTFVEQKITNLS